MATTTTKRSRASAEQLSQMVDFMAINPGFGGGKFEKLHGKLESDKKWSELADLLNCLGGANLQLLLEDGEDNGVPSPSNTEVTFDWQCDTPGTSKRKRAEDDCETRKQFLDIATKQSDALKILAECNASNAATNKIIADAVKGMGNC